MLNKIFDFASQSKGMVVFIDEAEAFFRDRTGGQSISEDLRNSINLFLYRTGTPSYKVFFILATNVPQQMDKALLDRVD